MSIPAGPSEGVLDRCEEGLSKIQPGDQQITPDPALVAALEASIRTYERHTREDSKHPWYLRENCAYPDPSRFSPPSQLSPADRRTNLERRFWKEWARYVSRHARERAFGEQTSMRPEVRNKLMERRPEVKGLRLDRVASGDEKGDVRLWWNLDPLETTPDNAVEASRALLADITIRLRGGFEEVLKDAVLMEQIRRTIVLATRVHANVVLENTAGYLETLRQQIESPEERERFLFLYRQMAAVLGCGSDQLDVELLSAIDALVNGAKALYKPSPQGLDGKGTISLPMSHYGTREILEIHEILELVAHEVAHHQMERARLKGQPVHGMSHNVLAAENLRRLQACRVELIKCDKQIYPILRVPSDMDIDVNLEDKIIRMGDVHPIEEALKKGNAAALKRILEETPTPAAASVAPPRPTPAAPVAPASVPAKPKPKGWWDRFIKWL